MFPETAAQWHAALNDFPSLLFIYEYGGGIPTAVLEGALQERATAHTRGPGEEHE